MIPTINKLLDQLNWTKTKPSIPLRKLLVAALFNNWPKPIAEINPNSDPINPIKIASQLKIENTFPRPKPRAFIKPISRVRSRTDM